MALLQSDKQQLVLVALETYELIICYAHQEHRLSGKRNYLGLLVSEQGMGAAILLLLSG